MGERMRLVLAIGDGANEAPTLGDDESALVMAASGETRVILPDHLTANDKIPKLSLLLVSLMWRMNEDEAFLDEQMEWIDRFRAMQ